MNKKKGTRIKFEKLKYKNSRLKGAIKFFKKTYKNIKNKN
jgi:hypothetical protein